MNTKKDWEAKSMVYKDRWKCFRWLQVILLISERQRHDCQRIGSLCCSCLLKMQKVLKTFCRFSISTDLVSVAYPWVCLIITVPFEMDCGVYLIKLTRQAMYFSYCTSVLTLLSFSTCFIIYWLWKSAVQRSKPPAVTKWLFRLVFRQDGNGGRWKQHFLCSLIMCDYLWLWL